MFDSEEYSYRWLDERSNQLAHELLGRGIRVEDRIALLVDRSADMVIAIYAILKAGAAYVPLDSQNPPERLANLVQDAEPTCAIVHTHFAQLVSTICPHLDLLVVDEPAASFHQQPKSQPDVCIEPSNLAYIMYTSGTTGMPKGVMLQHDGVLNRLQWGQELFELEVGERHIQKTPYTFDVSVPELFWPLQVGATLVLPKAGGHKDVDYLLELLRDTQVNVVHFVPSMLSAFLSVANSNDLAELRHIYCSGETISNSLCQLCTTVLPHVSLYNLYGPTEASVDVTSWRYRKDFSKEAPIPLGRATTNNTLYVLDDEMNLVADGVMGELYIAGVQVARGYWRRPEQDAMSMHADPFSKANAKMYRTGDLARKREDGVIEFCGRIDSQIKLRGYRIEPGEIEANLNKLDDVVHSTVALQEQPDREPRLVAFLKFTQHQPALDQTEIRKRLAEHLLPYMIPQRFVAIEAVPYTSTGKVDRQALLAAIPEMAITSISQDQFLSSSREQAIAEIWANALHIQSSEIRADDNFFDLGGHSLVALQMLKEVETVFRCKLKLQDVSYNTFQGFCTHVLDSADGNISRPHLLGRLWRMIFAKSPPGV